MAGDDSEQLTRQVRFLLTDSAGSTVIASMTTDQRLDRLECSVRRWRMFSLTLLLGMVALGFVGAEPFIPPENVGNFDVVHCQKLIVGGQNAFTMLATDGPQAELSLMSAENAGDNAVLHNIANIHVSKEEASV